MFPVILVMAAVQKIKAVFKPVNMRRQRAGEKSYQYFSWSDANSNNLPNL